MLTIRNEIAKIRIELLKNGKSIGAHTTDGEDKIVIGSAKVADFIVPAPEISKIHAMIRLKGTQIHLYDLGSEKGTFVLGKRIIEKNITGGEQIQIGGHELKIEVLSHTKAPEAQTEHCLFWSQTFGNAILSVAFIENKELQNLLHVNANKELCVNHNENNTIIPELSKKATFIKRRTEAGKQTAICMLPIGFSAEVYNHKNELIKKVDKQGELQFTQDEKVRLIFNELREIQIYWHSESKKISRSLPEKDRKSILQNFAIALCASLAIIGLLNISQQNDDLITNPGPTPTTPYYRVTSEAAQGGSEGAGESSTNKATNVSNMLSKLMQNTTSAVSSAITAGVNGVKTVRASSSFSKQDVSAGGIASSGITAANVGAGLQAAAGSGNKGLNGFGKGLIGASGLGTGNGKGFSLDIGSEEAEAIGGLDKALIAAVVQANLGQIKHCYEKQLLIDSNIFGKIVMQWTINKEGLVPQASVKKSTMNNTAVESCITNKIKTWEFPKPKGNGQVSVSYPFLFKSAN